MRHGRQGRMRSCLEAAHVRLRREAHAPPGTPAQSTEPRGTTHSVGCSVTVRSARSRRRSGAPSGPRARPLLRQPGRGRWRRGAVRARRAAPGPRSRGRAPAGRSRRGRTATSPSSRHVAVLGAGPCAEQPLEVGDRAHGHEPLQNQSARASLDEPRFSARVRRRCCLRDRRLWPRAFHDLGVVQILVVLRTTQSTAGPPLRARPRAAPRPLCPSRRESPVSLWLSRAYPRRYPMLYDARNQYSLIEQDRA